MSPVLPDEGAVLGVAGDLYLLKLYRDFVLHQTKEDGTPNLDWGHLVESLNKLDAGLQEKVCKLYLIKFIWKGVVMPVDQPGHCKLRFSVPV